MTNGTSPADLPRRPSQPDRPPPRERRPWLQRIAFAPLWFASVLALSLGIAATAVYLMTRRPIVVETVTPPPAAELSSEAVRRAEALRALNRTLAEQIDALRQQIEQPRCPPGTAIESTGGIDKSSFEEAAPRPPDSAARPPPTTARAD